MVGGVSNWAGTGINRVPRPSTGPREKDDKCSFFQGEFWGKHQLWVAAIGQSSGAEKGAGEVHWPGAPES